MLYSRIPTALAALLAVWVAQYPFAAIGLRLIIRITRLIYTAAIRIIYFFSFLWRCAVNCLRMTTTIARWIQACIINIHELPVVVSRGFFSRRGRYILPLLASIGLLLLLAGSHMWPVLSTTFADFPTPYEIYENAVWLVQSTRALTLLLAAEFDITGENASVWWSSWSDSWLLSSWSDSWLLSIWRSLSLAEICVMTVPPVVAAIVVRLFSGDRRTRTLNTHLQKRVKELELRAG
ncbi:hypothetical protein C8J57DRAFT_1296062 [Mycena rebaudengoi]|nr:hypothetical protein C8J57DRAFT_1296062 [Mycena rebaudengoi]